MYCMRRAALRKYTFAALNGAGEVTLPETLASPLSSDCAAALALQPTNESAASQMAMRMRGAPPRRPAESTPVPSDPPAVLRPFLLRCRAMRLSEEERDILAGKLGPVPRLALEHQVKVGDFFGAEDCVAVTQAHVMADTESLGEAGGDR